MDRGNLQAWLVGILVAVGFIVGMPIFSNTLTRVNRCASAMDAKTSSSSYHCDPQRLLFDKKNF